MDRTCSPGTGSTSDGLDPSPLDLYAIRRAVADVPLQDDVKAALPGPTRSLIEMIAGSDPDKRAGLIDVFCNLAKDPAAVRSSLEGMDPLGPPPEPADPDGSDWPTMRLYELPEPPSFPVDVFPARLAEFATSGASSLRTPVDFFGGPMLTVAGAAAGRSVALRLKGRSGRRGWLESPLQYLVLVAPPGRAKTPALSTVVYPLSRIDGAMRAASRAAHQKWLEAARAHKKDPDNCPPPGPEPMPQCCIVDDITRETLVSVHSNNPRGLLCFRDEARAWLNSFGEYKGGGGADRQFWLSNASGAAVRVNRKNDLNPLHIANPCVSFLGGIQPDFLGSFRESRGGDDGFMDRIQFVYPPPSAFPSRTAIGGDIDPFAEDSWGNAIQRIASLMPERDEEVGTIKPKEIAFSLGGRRAWDAFALALAQEMDSPDFPERFSGPWSKLETIAARLSLVMCLLRWADDPFSGAMPGPVEDADVEAAARLVDYFKAMYRRAVGEMNRGLDNPDARLLVRWLTQEGKAEFSEREAYREIGRFRNDREALADALKFLSDRRVVRIKVIEKGGRGRPQAPTYLVHPEIFSLDRMDRMDRNPVSGPEGAICVQSVHSVHEECTRESV